MKTLLLKSTDGDIKRAAEIIKNGGTVGMPTETVYGLAADALNGKSAAKIFEAKKRPQDNPLIVHLADFNDIKKFGLVSEIPKEAERLADAFWPGPFTMIMKKGSAVPDEVSAGLDTVAVRLPAHPVARSLIRVCETPLAAPSANLSGSPSPTTARHVLNDMDGRIDAIIDGGACSVGVESTVITLAGDIPRLLRPGGITPERIESVIGKIEVDGAVLNKLGDGAKAASPGMKYKHYSPKANVVLLKCSDREYISYVNRHCDIHTAALCCDEDIPFLNTAVFSVGKRNDYTEQARALFARLREIDLSGNINTVYSRLPSTDGLGLALYNRLIRAAGFEVKELEGL